jgi:CRP-like cAMP-binding protein
MLSSIDYNHLSLFQGLSASQNLLVKPIFQSVYEPAGNILFNQGDLADYLYLVLDGEVIIRYKPEDGPAIIVSRVRAEGIVGWSSALGSPSYTSSAVCTTDCQMLRVRGEDLRALCENYPETGALILERLAVVIAERLRNTYDHVITLLEQGLRLNEDKANATK